MKRLLLLAVSAATLSACATVTPAPPPPPTAANTFKADDFAWSVGAGSNVILGKVAYQLDGKAWTCAGAAVGLTPDTPYSRARMARLYGSPDKAVRTVSEVRSRQVGEAGADYSRYVRSVRCDAKGGFAFQGLPDGAWFVIAPVKPVGGEAEGRVIMQRVETRGGKTRTVTLS
ncbi:hypothetical protein [Caulobacter sp. 17J65-9]|uniref:hypothetical protein n=1 Tax=Caulobacter sp. 17J65-9 TaxID=2709382 RepID=UPI0013C5FA82|nr:hypothetical protein [Caulobacter sp. 17J65-9]NEX94498.1 hypothetical protein [Caulobacter sp. 17J65-9]